MRKRIGLKLFNTAKIITGKQPKDAQAALSVLFCLFFLFCILGGAIAARGSGECLGSYLEFVTVNAAERFAVASFWRNLLLPFCLLSVILLLYGGFAYSAFGVAGFVLAVAGQGSALGALGASFYAIYGARGVLYNVAVIAPVASAFIVFSSRVFAVGFRLNADILAGCFGNSQPDDRQSVNKTFLKVILWALFVSAVCALYFAFMQMLIGGLFVE